MELQSIVDTREIALLVDYCRAKLDLTDLQLPDEYGYKSLPLCIIDAVFSIGVTYTSTANTVSRFRSYANAQRPEAAELSISELIALYDETSVDYMAREVYRNLQRTSVKNGILKAEAVLRAARVLRDHKANVFTDFAQIANIPAFENAYMQIPGQRSGISLRYLYMLTGSVDHIKPDRMILRFIHAAIGRTPKIDESHRMILETTRILQQNAPNLNARHLDGLIWKFQSGRT